MAIDSTSPHAPTLGPELRLVFLSAAGEWADAPIRDLLDGNDLNWGVVFDAARRQGATSVLLRRLRRLAPSALPPDPTGAVAQVAGVEEFRMGLLQDRLVALLSRLNAREVPVVLLKGAAVALERLGGLQERPMGDLDLLVPKAEAPGAHGLAQELGWSLPGRGLESGMYRDLHHLIPLDAGDGVGFGLEIHTDLFPTWSPFRFSAADVRRDAVPLESAGLPPRALVPSLDHQLLHTCLHYAWSHCFDRGAWRMVRDLDTLLSDPRLNIDAFARLARDSRGATCTYWTVSVFEVLSGRRVPPDLIDALSPGVLTALRGPLLRHFTREGLRQGELPGTRRLRRALWTAAIRPRQSGHGVGRPWTGAERWPGAEDPFGLHRNEAARFSARVRGFLGYSTRVLGGRGGS